MNRAERRKAKKAGLPVKKEPVVNIKAADVEKIKQDASKDAANKAFLLMLGLPVMILHDKFGFGPVRCERFTDAVLGALQAALQKHLCKGGIRGRERVPHGQTRTRPSLY